jgi:hypothetical protein
MTGQIVRYWRFSSASLHCTISTAIGGKGDLFQTREIDGNDLAPSFVRGALDTPSRLDDHAL